MNVYHRIDTFQPNSNNILTIGTFDGVHLGHGYLLEQVIALSKKLAGIPTVVTFEPHPQLIVNNGRRNPIKTLTTLDEKIALLGKAGIRHIYVIQFDDEFAGLSSTQFIDIYLKKKIGLKAVIVGYDHGFGNARAGNANTLSTAFRDEGIRVEHLDRFTFNGQKISSSVIRRYISGGEIAAANAFLGYAYNLSGKVIVGDKRGRELGFPTANLDIGNSNKILPHNGVYAVKIDIDSTDYYGMANLGVRPTFLNSQKSLEINLFDFEKNIYGKNIRVFFLKKIRDEIKFATADALANQLQADKVEALFFLKSQYTV